MVTKTLFYYASLMVLYSLSFMGGTGYETGDKVTDFSLKNVDGNKVSLAGYATAKKGAIVVFTCNHCPFSKKYEDRIIALNSKFAPKGYPVIAINPNDPGIEPDDSFEEMKKRAASKKFTFPYLADETQQTAKAFGAERTPHVFVLQRTGNSFTVEYTGAIDNNANSAALADTKYVEKAIEELLENKPVSIKKAKAIGCGIKWK